MGCGSGCGGGPVYDPWRPIGDPARAGDATVYNPQPKGRKVVWDVTSKFGTVTFDDKTMADLSAGQTGGRISKRYVQDAEAAA